MRRARRHTAMFALATTCAACAVIPACGSSAAPGTRDLDASSDGDAVALSVADAREDVPAPRPEWGLEHVASGACLPPSAGPKPGTVKIARIFPELPLFDRPTEIVRRPTSRGFVVLEQIGRISTFEPGATVKTPLLDIVAKVYSGGEAGLLGLAFHPRFPERRAAWIYYTRLHPTPTATFPEQSVLARYAVNDDLTFDKASEQILLTVDQAAALHKGGKVAFGPDGDLYVSIGDATITADAQDTTKLRGKVLRIDVDRGTPYAIPTGNPFATTDAGRPEVFAWGFRNPWRFSFDDASGDLWLGDVGQGAWDEIDRVVAGGNYGWPLREGAHCYLGATCDPGGLVDPVAEHATSATSAIIGGRVYHGKALPGLAGKYVHGSWFGRFFVLDRDPATNKLAPTLLNPIDEQLRPTAIAEDEDGELVFTNWSPGTLHQIVPGDPPDAGPPAAGPPVHLGATSCIGAGVPYEVNSPQWSDGATAERRLALPEGARLSLGADPALPPRAVAMQTLSVGGRRIETRLLGRRDDGTWAALSYAWNDTQTDAELVVGSRLRDLGGGRAWYYPSETECMQCHAPNAGTTLGITLAQLDRSVSYPNGSTNTSQLANLVHAGVIDTAASPHDILVDPSSSTAALTARARSYLHANCSSCHRPGGIGPHDLRISADTKPLCDAAPLEGTLGVADGKLIAKGDPARSLLSMRMHRTGLGRMPPLATRIVDANAIQLLDDWITREACP